jgi:hypothetical protein
MAESTTKNGYEWINEGCDARLSNQTVGCDETN